MKSIKRFFLFLTAVTAIISLLGEFSLLNAQVQYQNISLCKLCYEAQESGSGRCLGCNKITYLTQIRAKICNECYFKKGGLLELGCRYCKANVVGGGYAWLCQDCAQKDVCIECGKFLGSGDTPDESSGRKVVGKYTITVTVPGKKEEFWKYWNSATAAYEKQNYEEALNYFKKCDEIIPDGPACQIGMCLRGLEKYDEAIKYFDIAIKNDPKFSDSYYHKGLALVSLGKMNEAEPLLKKAIDLNTEEGYAYLLFAFLRESNYKDFDQAIKYYEQGFALSPSTSKFRGNLINLYQQTGRLGDALRHADIACELLDNNIESLNTKAELLFNFSKWGEAVPVYEKIISMNPNNVHIAHYFLGICQYQLKEFENARDNWVKTIELDENKNPETYSCLAACEAKLNNPDDALKYCDETLRRMNRESSFIYYNLATAYSLTNEKDKALEILEKGLKTGGVNISYLESDPDMKNVTQTEAFKQMISKYK